MAVRTSRCESVSSGRSGRYSRARALNLRFRLCSGGDFLLPSSRTELVACVKILLGIILFTTSESKVDLVVVPAGL